jgi:hypothetical protein
MQRSTIMIAGGSNLSAPFLIPSDALEYQYLELKRETREKVALAVCVETDNLDVTVIKDQSHAWTL